MKLQRVALNLLRASAQPRQLITADVDKLAASIKEVGLIQPITVRPAAVMNGIATQGFQIVAGHHRVAACRALGWDEIDAIVVDVAEHLGAELIEIDENLCRSELTAAQRSKAVKRRREIWEALHPNSGAACATTPDRGPGRPVEFAADTAKVTGESKSQINRHVARAEALGDDLDKVTGTSLDKGVELDALKAMPPEQRAPLIERAQAGECVSARAAPAQQPKPTHTTASIVAALQSAMQRLLEGTGCATVDEVITLICATFGPEHPDDVSLCPLLDSFCAVGHLEPQAEKVVVAP